VNVLKLKHIAAFMRGDEVLPEARIRMAAAVQSFVSGNVALSIALPAGTSVEKSEKLLLAAWLQGMKGLTLEHVPSERPAIVEGKPKRAVISPFLHAKKPILPSRKSKPKAGSRLMELVKVKSVTGEVKRH
jgi:ribonucleotide reductase alpha subunit